MRVAGFIFQSTYRVVRGAPVVLLHGRLTSGETFLVRDGRARVTFWIRREDEERARALGAAPRPDDRRTFSGAATSRIEVAIPQDVPALRDRLESAGIRTYEADVRFAVRYLIERGVRGACTIEGAARRGESIDWIFDEPDVRPAEADVEPRVLAFDIETDPAADRLLAIALYGSAIDEVLIVDPGQRPLPERARGFADERACLAAFCEAVRVLDPDILTGWNVVDFDLTMLARVAARCRHPLALGREGGTVRLTPARGYFGSQQASLPGRVVLDGIDLLRGAFVRLDDYSLDAVARRVLGEGKAMSADVGDRAAEIQRNYRDDLAAFAHYARTDARLALEIVQRQKLVELAMARSRLTGMSVDRVAASIASFDFLYLEALGRRGVVAPTVRSDDARGAVAQAGGHVLEPTPGLHRNVWVFDFKSLYPSAMRTFNVDPLGYVARPSPGEDVVETPSGACFRRGPAILPQILDALFPRRESAKREGDAVASQAIKILMNSFYGVLGTPGCRFYEPALANAITGAGRHVLKWSKAWFEGRGLRVLYGDTDSLFVAADVVDPDAALARGPALAAELTRELANEVLARYRVTSRLELQFEKLYLELLLPSMRRGAGGARKRYAGRLAGTGEVEFVGMEVVRRDSTELAKSVQRELYRRLFAGEEVADYLADVVARVRAGTLDDLLVYRKGLRRSLDAYTTSIPPHVQAARKSTAAPGRRVAYVVTTAGPEPVDQRRNPVDREHYVEKQVRPVAEPVLAALSLDFETVIGDARQIGLF